MKKETKKEFGKLIFDFAKISFGIAFLTPLVKENTKFDYMSILVPIFFAIIIGLYLIEEGASE